ncbi:MAG TPA: HAMP domain-containing sensor histidine kinase [Thermoanaerobaculia bacterium]
MNKIRRQLSVESLLWAMSLFCAFIGAFLLVAPHHFQTGPYQALLPFWLAWGALALASGVGLLAVAVVRPRPWVRLGVHAMAGVTLLALAVSFGMVKALTGMFTYTILGLGMLLSGLLPRDSPEHAPRGDLFALLISLAATVSGALVFLLPDLFRNPFYGPFRSYFQVIALALLLTAPLLAWAQLAPTFDDRRLRILHVLTGLTYFSFGAVISIPSRVWTGVVLYCGGGLLVAFLPAIRRRLTALDTSALRTRLALALAIATSLALISATAVTSGLGWVVAAEAPRAAALEGIRHGRDLAFALLLLVIPLAALIGIVAARRIARPLDQLADAVDALSAGDLAAPVATGAGITEVARLSAAFQEMRDRLSERTRESERLAAELRARAEALAETDRRKDEFLAMLAHELRNPLGAIANASYLLEQLGTDHPRKARAVEIIRRQIQHLVVMVDDLLDVSRITRGKVELRREPLDLAEVVRHSVETARPLAEAKEQRLSLELAPEPLPMRGDATRLEQVLSNLLRNAVKFTESGGNIDVSARPDGGDAVVRVKDDGIGMAPDLLPRIFDLFAQGEQALDRSGAGLGIGLTLVRSLVEMHGGTVEARSEGPGKGSELEVRLPLEPAAALSLVPPH